MGYDIPQDHHTSGPTQEEKAAQDILAPNGRKVPRKFLGMPEPSAELIEAQMLLASQAKVEAAFPFLPALGALTQLIHSANAKWWHDPKTGERLVRNKGELLMLVVSELAEAMEGERKNLMDTHLPQRKMAEVELADVLIRIFDYAGGFGYDLGGAVRDKLIYNLSRADHTYAARNAENGKKF